MTLDELQADAAELRQLGLGVLRLRLALQDPQALAWLLAVAELVDQPQAHPN